jgi:hypothetical protein
MDDGLDRSTIINISPSPSDGRSEKWLARPGSFLNKSYPFVISHVHSFLVQVYLPSSLSTVIIKLMSSKSSGP